MSKSTQSEWDSKTTSVRMTPTADGHVIPVTRPVFLSQPLYPVYPTDERTWRLCSFASSAFCFGRIGLYCPNTHWYVSLASNYNMLATSSLALMPTNTFLVEHSAVFRASCCIRGLPRCCPGLSEQSEQRKLAPRASIPYMTERPNYQYGIGSPVPVFNLTQEFDGSLALIWADGTNGSSFPDPADIMSRVTRRFSSRQLHAVRKVASPADIPSACPQNFNLFSECFAAVSFNSIPPMNNTDALPINYTISADGGLFHIDSPKHNSDYEKRILPLQWALDEVCL